MFVLFQKNFMWVLFGLYFVFLLTFILTFLLWIEIINNSHTTLLPKPLISGSISKYFNYMDELFKELNNSEKDTGIYGRVGRFYRRLIEVKVRNISRNAVRDF